VALVEARVRAAFAAWESPVLRFQVQFDCSSGEIWLHTISDASSIYYGITTWSGGGGPTPWPFAAQRLLTNGRRFDGFAIIGANIGLNLARILPLVATLTPEQQLAALQRLIMHEVGHAIGIEHPAGSSTNNLQKLYLDLDDNPFNTVQLDWVSPFDDLIVSPNYDPEAIMMRELTNYTALFYNELRNDDRAARDVLYPLPPPDSDGDGVLDANDACPLTPGAACTLAPGDLILNGYITPMVPASSAQLLLLPPSGLARAVYAPSSGGAGVIRAAAFAENVIAAAVPVTPAAWELRLADLARGRESVVLSGLPRPFDLAVDAAGKIVVALPNGAAPPAATIVRIDPTSGASTPVGSGFSSVGALALDTDQASVIAAVGSDAVTTFIRRFAAAGGTTDLTSFAVVPGRGLAVEANGDVLFAAQLSPLGFGIHRVTRSTGLTATLADGFATFHGLAVRGDGGIFVAFRDGALGDQLDRVDAVTGAKLPIPVSGFGVGFDSAPGLFAVPSFAPDPDADGVSGAADRCPYARNPDQRDSDGQGGGDVCDPCPLDPLDLCARANGASASIGPAGGVVATPSGIVSLQVPAGALAAETSLSISNTGTDLELAGAVPGVVRVQLGPEGQTFAAPLTVTLRWNDANNDGVVDLPPIQPAVFENDLRLLRNGVPISQVCSHSSNQPPACTTSCCDRLQNQWTLQVTSFSEYRLDGAPDGDLDLVAAGDNCPFTRNPSQSDANGDGAGDACQCGDVNASGTVTVADVSAIRNALARAAPLGSPGNCNVHGSADPLLALGALAPHDCAIDDVAVLRRALDGRAPGIARVCAGTPVLD
jgi:hypothetical protein